MALWKTSLENLRESFQAAAERFPGFSVWLFHAGLGENDRLKSKPPHFLETRVNGGGSLYGLGEPKQQAVREIWFADDLDARRQFVQLATDAGAVLSELPSEALQGLPPETLRQSGIFRWVYALFDWSWEDRPGSLLRAERQFCLGDVTLQYDAAERGLRTPSGLPPDFPDYFSSELRNVFGASVAAIDYMLSATDGDGEPDRKAVKVSDEAELSGEEKALGLLVGHPEWTDTQIAKATGCARQTLYKWDRFTAARETLKSGRDKLPRGEKDRETGKIEAWEA